MKNNLLFDFSVNRKNKTIHIKRAFDVPATLVWQAWTDPKLLDKWCAPKPYRTETKTMEFREGGFWHYALVSPSGGKHWSRYDYKKIDPKKSITEWRVFSDENGLISPDYQPTVCTITFNEQDGQTLVTMEEKYGSAEMFKKMASDSHKKGFSAHLCNLEELLFTLKDNYNETDIII